MRRTYKAITIHDVEEAGGSVSSVPHELKDKLTLLLKFIGIQSEVSVSWEMF
jgi:hypothetical protein